GSTSSKAKASTAAYVARSAAARAGERRSLDADGSDNTAGAAVRLYVAHPELGRLQESWPEGRASGRSRQKPGKMYDQNAQAIDRTLSDRRKAEKAAAVSKPRGQATKLILALGIIVVLGIGLYFAIPEVTRIQKVTVNGRAGMSEQEIVDALQLTAEVNLVNADLPAMESRILSNPKAASVHISRGFPDRLVIDLTERKPVACVLVSDAAGTRPIAIDVEGVAFAAMDEMSGARKVPILSGIRFENFRPGQRLPSFLQPLLSDIAVLLEENPSVLDAFSEIKVEKIADSDAELVLYPNGKNVPVRMPLRLTKTNLGSALLVLDILSGRPDADMIQELDFRSGTIVYRTKEAQPG
ncbi:MAG: FtsQ-type POTRA domain-containing protein, partial [Spirochaetaceae bacterium]|nr:FtsQ-type POTRA domain-containing protein [Spirochaetaceae bacterium]